jgi:Dolichyl-phosphate-mannose-protein mannosyltransferase
MTARADLEVEQADHSAARRTWLDRATIERLAFVGAVALVLLAGAWPRFADANWDDGSHIHPDERYISSVAAAVDWPGSLPGYLDVDSPLSPYNTETGLHYSYGTLPLLATKVVAALAGRDDYDHLYLVGRVLSALLDLVTVLLVFVAARLVLRRHGERTATWGGLLAAGLYACTVAAIQAAHFFTTDVWLVTFGLLAFVLAAFSVEEAARGAGRRFPTLIALAGVAAGLALASKASGALLVVPLAVALVGRVFLLRRSGAPRAWLMLARDTAVLMVGAYVSFRLASPYAFRSSNWLDVTLDPRYRAALEEQRNILSGRALYPPTFQWLVSPRVWDPFRNLVVWQIGVAFGVCALAGLGLLVAGLVRPVAAALRRRAAPRFASADQLAWFVVDAMLVSFVAVVFIYMSTRFQHMGRYLLPIVPLLAVAAAFGLVSALRHRPRVLVGAAAAVLVATAAYALAFTNVYDGPTTRVEASRWITANVADGSTIANEHWDDSLPLGAAAAAPYRLVSVPVFEPDDDRKARMLYDALASADVYVLSSPRAWRTVGRMPDRFPLMTRFYRELFAGRLGFAPTARFTSEPRLLGVTLNDLSAEEAFSVYDHPQVDLFRRDRALSWDEFRRVLCPTVSRPACQ